MAVNRRTSQRVTLVMLVLASVTVLALDYHGEVANAITHIRNGVRDAVSPLQRGAAAALHPIGDAFSGAFHYGSLKTENAQLRATLGSLRRELASQATQAHAAERVLALNHLSYVTGIPLVPAVVISGPTSNFEDTIELLRGTGSGVGKGMPVLAQSGLVGTVSSASSSTATVLELDDKGTAVPVRVEGGGVYRAIGEGDGEPLSLDYVAGPQKVHRGELVVTSGLGGGTMPAGIPVGVVSQVHVSASGLRTAVRATPVVDLDDLQFVDVLQWLEPA